MKLSILRLSILSLAFAVGANGQSILLKTGQTLEALSVRRDGDMVMAKVQIGSGNGEVGYHFAQIAKIEFPEPRGLKAAADLLGQGQPDKALAEINQVLAYYEQFKEVPGSWWAQSALIKVSALGALQREGEAEALAAEIQKTAADPETARAAQLRLVPALIRKRDFEKAVAICDGAIKESSDPTTLASAWIDKGDVLLAQKNSDEALLAYLHVPVFYYDEKSFMPTALLGSARAYRRLDNADLAKKSLNELIANFPQSAEATVAQTELKKLQ